MDNARHQGSLPDKEGQEERSRIERVYHAYAADPYYRRIWSSDAARFIVDRKWEEIARILASERVSLPTARLLDIGVGNGADCARFCKIGLRPERVVAIDLRGETARGAKRSHAWLTVLQADGARLPFRDGALEVVYQSTMLSSVLDRDRRKQILMEVQRVLARDGLFLSYDTRYPNPWNRNTSPLSSSEIRSAFEGWRVTVRTTTPIPPLARLVGGLSRALLPAIERVPLFRSHLLAVVRRA